MSSRIYTAGHYKINKGTINLESDTIKILLVNSGFAFNDAHEFVSDISGELSGVDNYARPTVAVSMVKKLSAHQSVAILAQPTFSNLGGETNDTITGVVVFKHTGSDSTASLISYHELNTPITTNGSNIKIEFDQTNGNIYWQDVNA